MKTLLMMDHTSPNFRNNDPNGEHFEYIEVEAYVVGGLEGVFAIYRLEEKPDTYYFASGDDGNWWRISNGLDSTWLGQVYYVFGELMLDRF